jgi:formylglycine-generating enzyme required for sulfatase activity
VKSIGSATVRLEAFITRFKDTFYFDLARARIEELKKRQVAVVVTPRASESPSIKLKSAAITPVPAPTRCDGIETSVGPERRCLKPGDSFKDCPKCPEMVVVPAGSFIMGSPAHRLLAIGQLWRSNKKLVPIVRTIE